MKKILSLLMTVILLVTVVGAAPTVFAEELPYTEVSEEMFEEYWDCYFSDGVVKIDDWYYSFRVKTSTNEKNIFAVCGYDGKETEITIPTELDGIEISKMYDFQLLSDTVKTIKIPTKIDEIIEARESYDSNAFYIECTGESRLEEIIVESGNSEFWSRDGVLYEGPVLAFYPPKKKDTEYIVPEGVSEIASRAINNQKYLKSVTITKNVELIHEDALPDTLEYLYIHTIEPIVDNITDEYFPSIFNGIAYMPKAKTIHCIENSEAHSFYKNNISFYENLVVLKDKFIKKDDGRWYFYRGGVIDVSSNYDSMSIYARDLVKYKDKWFYTIRGVWSKKTLLYEHEYKWFYIKNGKWSKSTTDLIKYKDKWFYIRNGKWHSTDCTLFKKKGKWFYIKNGKWCKDTAIVKYKGKRFYVKKGKVDFDFSGKKKIDGKTYKIKNGKVA